MNEVKKEKQHISLSVCDEKLDIYVKSPEEEGYYREAATLINGTYGRYAEMFRGRRSERFIAAATLLDVGVKFQMEHANKETDTYNDFFSRLTSEIEEALK